MAPNQIKNQFSKEVHLIIINLAAKNYPITYIRSRMIKKLSVQNYAIIASVEVNFAEGLTIITGETGAGKSILLGALGLIMGNRADTKVLFQEGKKCVVEGVFGIGRYDLKGFFEENDLDFEQELIIRREISPSGKSRSFINDTPVKLKLLKTLTEALIDLHQQFDTQDIHQVSFQLRMVDALAGNEQKRLEYQEAYKAYASRLKKLNKLIKQQETQDQEKDFLRFQYDELVQENFHNGEQDELEKEQKMLQHAEKVKQVFSQAHQLLSNPETALLSQLQDVGISLKDLSSLNPEIDGLIEQYNGALLEVESVASRMESLAEETELNEERLVEVQDRLSAMYRLQQKHKVSGLAELLNLQAEFEAALSGNERLDQEIEALENEVGALEEMMEKLSEGLSASRRAVLAPFEKKVSKRLDELAMPHAQIQIAMEPLEEFALTGKDKIEFLFSANPGGRFEPIKEVASGGELSRLALSIKSLVASAIPLPTLIFDEIDSGVSGEVALRMGKILRKLAKGHQVVSITHTPQIAVQAHAHYQIFKKMETDRMVTGVKLLGEKEKIHEIAVMLSGNPPSKPALKNAKDLLNSRSN